MEGKVSVGFYGSSAQALFEIVIVVVVKSIFHL
jgi:hypothetical protein